MLNNVEATHGAHEYYRKFVGNYLESVLESSTLFDTN